MDVVPRCVHRYRLCGGQEMRVEIHRLAPGMRAAQARLVPRLVLRAGAAEAER